MGKKKIGLYGGLSVGIGFIIATSTFISLATGTGEIGIWFILTMFVVTLVNLMVAASIAELNALMPNLTGGLAQYTMVGTGPFLAIVVMVGGYFVSNVFAGPAEGHMFAIVMHDFIGGGIPMPVWSIGITVVLVGLNLLGLSTTVKTQMVISGFMIASLLIFGVVGAFRLGYGEVVDLERQMEITMPALDFNIMRVLPLASVAFWLFIGSEFVTPVGRAMVKPKKNVPRAMVLTLVSMFILKALMAVGMHFYTPWDEIAESNSPHMLYGVALFGPRVGFYWMIAIALFAAVGTYNAIIFAVGEICAGMAKIKLLPAVFAKTNRFGAPYMVIVPLGVLSVLVLATGVADSDAIQFLILTSSFFWMLAYIVSHINVLVLRRRMRNVPRTFKVPLGPLFPIIGISFTAFMIWNISTDPTERIEIFILSGILLVVLTVYATIWCKKYLKLPLFKPMSMEKVMAMEHPLYMVVNEKAKHGAPPPEEG